MFGHVDRRPAAAGRRRRPLRGRYTVPEAVALPVIVPEAPVFDRLPLAWTLPEVPGRDVAVHLEVAVDENRRVRQRGGGGGRGVERIHRLDHAREPDRGAVRAVADRAKNQRGRWSSLLMMPFSPIAVRCAAVSGVS